jgi:hypothetical protein
VAVTLFSADTETFLIAPGLQAPPLVCLQFAYDDDAIQVLHVRDPACYLHVRAAVEGPAIWNFQNTAFDVCVLMAQYPDLIEPLFDLYERDQVCDTIIRQKLFDIAKGRFKIMSRRGYALDRIASAHKLDLGLDKNDPWRLRYGELVDTPVSAWPVEARRYAEKDVYAQRLIWHAQEKYAASRAIPLDDQFRQTRKALWLRLMECRGFMVDPRRTEAYIAEVRKVLEHDREELLAAGLVRNNGTKNMLEAKRHMVEHCRRAGHEDIPLTDGGEESYAAWLLAAGALGFVEGEDVADTLNRAPIGLTYSWWETQKDNALAGVSLNEDSVILYGDDLMESYQRYATSTTQLARAERLYLAARAGKPIQSTFGTLQDTGRTSCSQGDARKGTDANKSPTAYGAQIQNPANDKKIKRRDGSVFLRKGPRELFVPRRGRLLCSTDYPSAELFGWAQCCIWAGIPSRLASVLNNGGDPHAELGAELAGISVEEAYRRKDANDRDFIDKHRKTGKHGNFAFMGGAGAPRFVDMVWKLARQQIPLEQDTPEGPSAVTVRNAWYKTWPEARPYFRWVSRQLSGERGNERGDFTQFWSKRRRGGLWFSAMANTPFQGLIADIAGAACWRITREMYTGKCWDDRTRPSPLAGGFLVDFLHDEPISELLEERAHEGAFRQGEIQTATAREIGPDVSWGEIEPALMERWYKSAEWVFEHGPECKSGGKSTSTCKHTCRLIPWRPKENKAA